MRLPGGFHNFFHKLEITQAGWFGLPIANLFLLFRPADIARFRGPALSFLTVVIEENAGPFLI